MAPLSGNEETKVNILWVLRVLNMILEGEQNQYNLWTTFSLVVQKVTMDSKKIGTRGNPSFLLEHHTT